jgi:uncharacterized protein Yka (UPF0111/DUF47 family)
MATARTTNGESGFVAAGQSGSSLEQVRELLFGQSQREFERKLARIDAHLASQGDDVRKEMRRRLEELQGHLFQEMETLAGRLGSERSEHSDAMNHLAREMRESIGALEQRMTRFEESLGRIQRDVRQQILDQSKHFIEEMQVVKAELLRVLEHELTSFAGEERLGGSLVDDTTGTATGTSSAH